MIYRRTFIVGSLALLAAPLSGEAQPATVSRIGILTTGNSPLHGAHTGV